MLTTHHSSDHGVLELSTVTSQLNTDDIGIIYGLKKDRLGKLKAVFPELRKMDEAALDLGALVNKIFACQYGTMYRNYLMDAIVLSMAEVHQCNTRADFNKALKALLGVNFNSTWHSRFHNSVHHVLRANSISCFPQQKRHRNSRNCKCRHHLRRVAEVHNHIGRNASLTFVGEASNGGFPPGLLDMSVIAVDTAHIDGHGQTTPTSKRPSSPVPPPIHHARHRHLGFAPIFAGTVEVYTAGGECIDFDITEALATTGDLRLTIALKRGVSYSQVKLFCGASEVDDNTAIMAEDSLSVVFQQ